MKLSLDDQIIDSQSLTLAILASLIFGESIGFVGGAGFVLGVMGLLLPEGREVAEAIGRDRREQRTLAEFKT
ncbi:hypothetical protein ACB092_11G055100 [Castanea dentata]